MPQIHVTLDEYLIKNCFCPGQQLDSFIKGIGPLAEKRFGIEGKNDTTVTVIGAVRTVGEANIQVEIRYTAGTDEYGTGEIFDPKVMVQEELIEDVHKSFLNFPLFKFAAPAITLSVWCQPHYGGAFKSFR